MIRATCAMSRAVGESRTIGLSLILRNIARRHLNGIGTCAFSRVAQRRRTMRPMNSTISNIRTYPRQRDSGGRRRTWNTILWASALLEPRCHAQVVEGHGGRSERATSLRQLRSRGRVRSSVDVDRDRESLRVARASRSPPHSRRQSGKRRARVLRRLGARNVTRSRAIVAAPQAVALLNARSGGTSGAQDVAVRAVQLGHFDSRDSTRSALTVLTSPSQALRARMGALCTRIAVGAYPDPRTECAFASLPVVRLLRS